MATGRTINRCSLAVIVGLVLVMVVIYENPISTRMPELPRPWSRFELSAQSEAQRYGYVIGWDFHEGQTCASRNLLSLIHWASTINFSVVEPCVHNSFFNMFRCFNSSFRNGSLYFSDYFNVDYWNQQVLLKQFGKALVPWKEFIIDKPHKAIIVYLWRQEGVELGALVGEDAIQGAPRCNSKYGRPQFTRSVLHNFEIKIVREVCIRYDYFKRMDVQWFTEQILGDYRTDVLILFTYWPGAFNGRVYFNVEYLHHKEANQFLKTSQRVIEDSKKYQQLFLGDEYIAVALRIAKIATHLSLKHTPIEKIKELLTEKCTYELSSATEDINITGRVLALDLGRFGDNEIFDIDKDTINKLVPKLVNIVYGDKWDWNQWEDSFVQATGGVEDSGYIALVQKSIVANASCLIVAGPHSEFQQSMLKEYEARVKHPCIHHVCHLGIS